MSTLRTQIHAILQTRSPQLAENWAADCPAAPLQPELRYYNGYFYGLLGRLRIDTLRQRQCLLGNVDNQDHWLRDFANVVAPMLDDYSPELFGCGSRFDRSLRGLQGLTTPR